MNNTCCGGEFSCQGKRFINPDFAHLFPDATPEELGQLPVEPERGSRLSRFKNVVAIAMHEAGLRYAESSRFL